LSVVVTDTELVSDAVNLTIDRILPIFTNALAGVDVVNNPVSLNSDEYFTTAGQTIVINDTFENNGGVDLIKIAFITEIDDIVFSKFENDLTITVVDEIVGIDDNRVQNDDDEEDEQEDVVRITSVVVVNQFGATDDFGATPEDFRIEYVRFAEQASYNGYVLNTTIVGQPLDETGIYKIQPGANGDHCQDLLISFADSVDYLYGDAGNDLLFAYGFNDILEGGSGFDLLVIGDHPDEINQIVATVVLDHSVDRKDNLVDEFDTVVNFDEHSIIQLGNLMITFEDEDRRVNVAPDNIIDRIEFTELSSYLAAQTEENFYLITYSGVDIENPNGTDSNIWHFSGNVANRVVDQVAHFVEFNFFDYRVTAMPVIG
jgi:Ca2+-binding RTX toxin-like protein